MSAVATRLPAEERRKAIIDAALRVFSAGSYSGATTAAIARESGVSEPTLYRHFVSKRDLYLACIEAEWIRTQAALVAKMDTHGAAQTWSALCASTMREMTAVLTSLWMQAFTVAGGDPEIRCYLRAHMREVHEFFTDYLRRVQREGAIHPDRNIDAEAWILIGGTFLVSIADRLGGALTADLNDIVAERQRWLRGVFPDDD